MADVTRFIMGNTFIVYNFLCLKLYSYAEIAGQSVKWLAFGTRRGSF